MTIATFENNRLAFFARCGVVMRPRTFHDRAGKAIHAIENRRDGEPVIVIHGGGGGACSAEWAPLLPLLSPQRRWICVDRAGCGLSDPIRYHRASLRRVAVHYLEDVLRGLGLARAAFLANSLGGYFAIAFAHAHPDQVDRLVLIGAPAGVARWLPWPLRLLGLPGVNRLMFATMAHPTPEQLRDRIFRRLLVAHAERVPDEFLQIVSDAAQRPGAQMAWRTLLEAITTLRGFRSRLSIREDLCRLPVPTSFIWGDRDAFDPPATGADLVERMFDAQLTTIEGAGHLPWLDEPAACARAVEHALGARAQLPAADPAPRPGRRGRGMDRTGG